MPEQVVGPLTYVDVRGQDQATAAANLDAAGILYEFADSSVYSSVYAVGQIAVQSPDPDITTQIAVDSTVTLTVSLGVGGGRGLSFMNDFYFRF
jgi:beta-lactam-binding protein with PASTA domain